MPIKGLYSAGDCTAGDIYGNPPLSACGLSSISLSLGFVCAGPLAYFSLNTKCCYRSNETPPI